MELSQEVQIYFINHIEIIYEVTHDVLNEFYKDKINDLFYGKSDKNRIVVLGAFDTWPYMDYVSRILAKNNYIVLTSRYLYHRLNDKIIRFPSTEISQLASSDLSMKRLLKKIIGSSLLAIINYSVSAAHYIETDWCEREADLDYIGIAHVRDTFKENYCENLEIKEVTNGMSYYSICKAIESSKKNWNAWDCISISEFCPFKQQDISKNVLEYYFNKNKDLKLISYNNLEDLPEIINNELIGKLKTLKESEQKEFHDYFSHFDLKEKEIDTLFIKGGLEFIVFMRICCLLFQKFTKNFSLKLIELFELIYNVIEKIPTSERNAVLDFYLKQLEKDYFDIIKTLRDIFTGKNDDLFDFIAGMSKLRESIYQNFGNWIINYLIENNFILISNAFWEFDKKCEKIIISLNIDAIINKKLKRKIKSIS